MQQPFRVWITKASERWQQIARPQQIAAVIGLALSVVLLVGFLMWSQQTTYGVLFSNLQSQDASAIVDKLKSQKIPYQLSNNGTAIMVPAPLVDDTRLMLAGNGLPNQGIVGFEIFDKQSALGMTDFTQQLDYQRGLQGELTRTIQQMNGVAQAWVTIVLPQSSLYTASQQDPTASITLRMNPGAKLDPGQVKAVMHLVASAVQALKPANVTVVDTSGTNLSDEVNSTSTANGVSASTYGTALDVEHSYEQRLSQQASSMLSTVLGSGKAVVRVNANLNWDQLQQDSTTYDGKNPNQVSTQQTNSTTSSNGTTTTSGVPGAASNLVPTATGTSGSGSTAYQQTQNNTVYDVSQTVEHLNKAPGSVQRLTVAVFLDGQYPATTITAIQNAVGNAIGLSNVRGDQITVSALPFNHATDTAAVAALKAQQQQSQIDLYIRGVALTLVALAVLIFALRASRRLRLAPASATSSVTLVAEQEAAFDQLKQQESVAVNELSAAQSQDGGVIMMTANPNDLLVAARQQHLSEAELQRNASIKENLLEVAENHPEMLANVVQVWFED